MTAPSAADLAATVRAGIRIHPDEPTDVMVDLEARALAALDDLVARCEQAELQRDEARKRAKWLYQDADAKYNEIRSLERERNEAQDALQSLAQDHYFARAESAEARVAELEQELSIEREANPNRVICPKCQANLPCESCKRYSVLVEELEETLRRAQFVLICEYGKVTHDPKRYDETGEGVEIIGETLDRIEALIGAYQPGMIARAALQSGGSDSR